MKKAIYYGYFLFGWILLFPTMAIAYVPSLGEVADSMTQGPVQGLQHFMNGVSILMGVIFVIVGFKKYVAYRDNLVETPLMAALRYLILGLILLFLPLVYFLVQRAGS